MQWVPRRLLPLWAPRLPELDRARLPDILQAIDASHTTNTAAKRAAPTMAKWNCRTVRSEPAGGVAIDIAHADDSPKWTLALDGQTVVRQQSLASSARWPAAFLTCGRSLRG